MEDHTLNTIVYRARLRCALAKMTNDWQRLIVVLRLMGYREREIAEVYGVSKARVGQVYCEFRKRNGVYYQEIENETQKLCNP